MDQECGGAGGGASPAGGGAAGAVTVTGSAGSFISLDEEEHRCYSGLHLLCQTDSISGGSGKLSSGKVAELFKTSQLPPEALHQVTEVCGAKRLGYFGTAQFYVALKLLAAAQSGLPVRLESVTQNLPLPRFVGLKNEAELRYVSQSVDPQGPQSGVSVGPVPVWAPADRGAFRHLETTVEKKETWSPPRSPCSSPPRSPPSYRSYPYGLQRNGTDLPLAYESKHCSRPIMQLDQHSSPSSYGMDQHSSPSSYGMRAVDQSTVPRVPSVERLDQRGGGEEYTEDDPWRITEEQQEYYTNQFRTLQPDLGALVLGTVAKNFFTKSKLPIPELSHIWELSDVDRDGALTFSEFCTAFHLIVARKNGYPLPESLPPTLRPPTESSDQDAHISPESAEPLIVFDDAEPRPSQLDRGVAERLQPALPPARLDMKEDPCEQDFSSSPQDKHTALQFCSFPGRPEPPNDLDPQMKTRSRPRSYSSTSIDDAMKKAEERQEPPTPPPRPQKKGHSRASSLDLNKLFQQGGAQGIKSGWLPPPPALPPRPSASQVPHFLSAAEKTPQKKKVQQPNFADFSRFREEDERGVKPQEKSPLRRAGPSTEDLTVPPLQDATGVSLNSHVPQKPVRRKYHADSLEGTPTLTTPFNLPAKPAQKLLSRQKREIQLAIRKNKETNAVLTRLNSELQQQLKEVHQERITLESQLDVLRPMAST